MTLSGLAEPEQGLRLVLELRLLIETPIIERSERAAYRESERQHAKRDRNHATRETHLYSPLVHASGSPRASARLSRALGLRGGEKLV